MLTREVMIERLIATAKSDPRIVGLVDYGSSNAGHDDTWSDVDVAVFVRDTDLDEFVRQWISWAGRLGPLLLSYVGGVGHPWTVYDVAPIPLRVDFVFLSESRLADLTEWTTAPSSIESFVWYDATGGRLTEYAQKLVGQSLAPADVYGMFDQVCGDFWYYCLRTLGKIQRGQQWVARYEYNQIIQGNLLALLKLEAGATDRWRNTSSALEIERVLSTERLGQLEACIPGRGMTNLKNAFQHAARLGYDVCQHLAQTNGWEWPQQLGERVIKLLLDPI
ncbi:MAG: aminoglycoside 6-adenylyltransferase [Anaerolineae bacterium]